MTKYERKTYDSDWDRLIGIEWPTLPEEAEEQAAVAARLTAEALAPASRNLVIQALKKLRERTNSRPSADPAFTIAVYGEDLMAYPPDVVLEACDRVGHREHWWPSWAELKAEADQLVRWRKAAYRHLSGETRV